MLLCQIPLKLRKNNIGLFCYLTRTKYLKICWEKSGKQCSLDAPNKQRHKCLTLSLPEYLMEICKVTLTFESADEILWCDHSNETSLTVLTHGAIYFSKFHKMKFGNLVEICFSLNLAVKGLNFDLGMTTQYRIAFFTCRNKRELFCSDQQ